MITAALVVKMSLLVTDAAGHHPTKGIPNEGAEAIASACTTTGAGAVCAAVLVVQAFRESGYRLAAVGDGGLAHGPFQVHGGAPKTWAEAVAQFVPLLQKSATTCKEPLAMIASGSCTNAAGIRISRERMALARKIAAEVSEEDGS